MAERFRRETVVNRVIWTDHAIQQAMDRFGPKKDLVIPNRVLILSGRKNRHRDEFRVYMDPVIYVCVVEASVVIIKTVMITQEEILRREASGRAATDNSV